MSEFTFLLTDIEGSTRLWEQHPQAMRAALERHDAILRQEVAARQGHVFKTAGDSFFVAFPSAPDALQTALAAQLRLIHEAAAAAGGEVEKMRVRMALYTGEAEVRDGDYFGQPLNRAYRLMAAAHGEQILLAETTAKALVDGLPPNARLKDLGRHRFKGLIHPEQVYQLVAPGLSTDFLPLRSLEALVHNLPSQITSFIGREKEIADGQRLLQAGRLLTLSGVGGTGKTRLALQLAASLLDEYPDGVWLVELATMVDSERVAQAVAEALGVREEPNRSMLDTLLDYLRSRQMLLVLDNCEHLVQACAQLVETLLHACPNLKVLITSREALGIAGEVIYHVPSLALPPTAPDSAPSPHTLMQFEAVRLFYERARAAQPAFELNPHNAQAVMQICTRLDGIPLAIELAAARLRTLPIEQVAARMHNRFRLLTGGSRTALPRQQTLEALIDWSYDLLSEPERILLRRLAVFVGGWTLEAAESVCPEEGPSGATIDPFDVLELLTRLVDKSLVVMENALPEGAIAGKEHLSPEYTVGSDRAPVRYRMLETIRQYALEKLVHADELAWARSRHLSHYSRFAEQAAPELWKADELKWMSLLDAELENLRAALEWSISDEEGAGIESGLRLGNALLHYWLPRGYLSEGYNWLKQIIDRPEAARLDQGRAEAINAAGLLLCNMSDTRTAQEYFEQSLSISRPAGYQLETAYALFGLGSVKLPDGRWAEARRDLQASLETFQALNFLPGIALALGQLGAVAMQERDLETGRRYFEESLAVCRQMEHFAGIAGATDALGYVASSQGRLEESIDLAQKALEMFWEAGDRIGMVEALFNLIYAFIHQENFSAALPLLKERLEICRKIGYEYGIFTSLDMLALTERYMKNHAEAVENTKKAAIIAQKMGFISALAYTQTGLGFELRYLNDESGARMALVKGLNLHQQVGDKFGILLHWLGFATLEVECGEKHEQPERLAWAVRLLGAIQALKEAHSILLNPIDLREYNLALQRARQGLDESAFQAAFTSGQAFGWEQAQEYVAALN